MTCMHHITGTNTWDYCIMIEQMVMNTFVLVNRSGRGIYHKKVLKPEAKKNLKSSLTSMKYWQQMTGWQRFCFAFITKSFGKSAGHEYVRKLKKSNPKKS